MEQGGFDIATYLCAENRVQAPHRSQSLMWGEVPGVYATTGVRGRGWRGPLKGCL